MFWLIPILINVALSVVSILIRPKPKAPKPEAMRDVETPTAEAGRPRPRIYGSLRISGVNVIDTMEKGSFQKEVKA